MRLHPRRHQDREAPVREAGQPRRPVEWADESGATDRSKQRFGLRAERVVAHLDDAIGPLLRCRPRAEREVAAGGATPHAASTRNARATAQGALTPRSRSGPDAETTTTIIAYAGSRPGARAIEERRSVQRLERQQQVGRRGVCRPCVHDGHVDGDPTRHGLTEVAISSSGRSPGSYSPAPRSARQRGWRSRTAASLQRPPR